jgi:hypothetical protein
MNDSQFTKLIIATQRAEARYNASPTDINFLRWHNLANEYRRVLRERQDAKAGTR